MTLRLRILLCWPALAAVLGAAEPASVPAVSFATPSGVKFDLLGGEPSSPAPTLFVFASDRQAAVESDEFNECGKALRRTHGCLCVSLDMPAHGDDRRPGEPAGLDGWRARLDHNENFVAPLVKNASEVLDYLIRKGFTDPRRIAAAGNSRGGFMAIQFAAAEPRIRALALFSPVTELTVLREFKGLEQQPLTQSLRLEPLTGALAGRPVWICIGNHDERVGTDQAVAFFRSLVRAAYNRGTSAPVEIHIMESQDHHTPAAASGLAAAWLGRQFDGIATP